MTLSMSRLDELVQRNPMLQRLRDVVCQLMLADRQQEELTNYVNGMLTNMRFEYGARNSVRMTPDGDVINYKGTDNFAVKGFGLQPVIRQVWPCQGSLGSIESEFVNDWFPFVGEFELQQFKRLVSEDAGGRMLWVGFVSDIYARGKVGFLPPTGSEPDVTYDFADYIKPWTSAGYAGRFVTMYQKLTDTSPLISQDGIIHVDLLQSRIWQSFLAQHDLGGANRPEQLPNFVVRGDFAVGFNYVGVAICLG